MANILKTFYQNEHKIEMLYRIYAHRFPRQKTLWLGLAEEENGHVKVLKELYAQFGKYKTEKIFKLNKYAKGVLDYISFYIDIQLKNAKDGRVTKMQSLETGLRIEQSMTENKSLELFTPKFDKILNALKRLNKETRGHIKALRKAYKKAL